MNKIQPKNMNYLIVFQLLILLSFWPSVANAADMQQSPPITQQQEITSDAPVVITGDADFESQAWPGSGTQENPYVVSDLYIRDSYECIRIENIKAYLVIENCTLEANNLDDSFGVSLLNVTNVMVKRCRISDGEWGIRVENSSGCEVTDCSVKNCNTGVTLQRAPNSTVYESATYRCNFGIAIQQSENCSVQSSRIFGNTVVGISLGPSTNSCIISGNSIGWNSVWTVSNNAQDDGHNNSWNNTSQGNEWENYNGTASYVIAGNASSLDYHPTLLTDDEPPDVNSPQDIAYEYGAEGLAVNWSFSDSYPRKIQIIRNNSTIRLLDWLENELSFGVDNLPHGAHNCTTLLTDWAGNQVSDSVRVVVMYSIFGGADTRYLVMSSILSVVAVAVVILVMVKTRG